MSNETSPPAGETSELPSAEYCSVVMGSGESAVPLTVTPLAVA